MTEFYEKNLKLLAKQNPLLALQLRLSEPADLKERKASIIPAPTTEIFYIYGVGSCYDELKKWLHEKPERRVIFIEDEQERFSYFLKQVEAERLLLDPQVRFIALTGSSHIEVLEEVLRTYLFRPYECFIMPGKDEAFRSHFSDLQLQTEMMMCLYRDYGLPQMKNVFTNSQRETIFGETLRGKFSNFPAIICGFGPSLKKNIEILKTLGHHALIFAGGSALSPLLREGVPVHIGAGIDPDPPLNRYESIDIPFFYQNQVSAELLTLVKGTSICMGASGGFPVEHWLVEDLLPFDGGTHVGTFLTHIATMLGCSPVIFVGMDGCCQGETLYYNGIEEDKRKDPLTTEDRFGHPVQSRQDFLLGRRWLERFATDHSKTLFLNATEGGLSISGIQNVSLQEAKEKWLKQRINPKALWQAATLSLHPKVPQTKLELLSKSVTKCQAICDDLLALLERNMHDGTYVNSLYALQDQELSEEVFYQFVLLPVWKMWQPFLQKEEVIARMQVPNFEKKVQQTLFYRDMSKQYARILC